MSLSKAEIKPSVKAKTTKKPKTNKQTKKAVPKKYVRITVRRVKKPKALTPDAWSYANFLKMAQRFTERATGKKVRPKRRIIFKRKPIKKITTKKISKKIAYTSDKVTPKVGPKIDAARTVAGSELIKAQMATTDPTNRLDPAARILAGAVASRPKQTTGSKKKPVKKKVTKPKKKPTTTKSSKKIV